MKTRDEVAWISEQVYDAPDVTYTTEQYEGASSVHYRWTHNPNQATGIAVLYGISREHAHQLISKWNRASIQWHYEVIE